MRWKLGPRYGATDTCLEYHGLSYFAHVMRNQKYIPTSAYYAGQGKEILENDKYLDCDDGQERHLWIDLGMQQIKSDEP